MIEVERKFRLDKEKANAVVEYLNTQLGSPAVTHQIDKVFLYKLDSFKNFKPGEPVMRIRSVNGVTTLTFKRKIATEGNLIEHELTVDLPDVAQSMLNELGYILVTNIEKNRSEYKSGEVTVCVDEVAGLGTFLEIEVICKSPDEIKDAEDKVMKMASDIKLDQSDIETKKYDELLDEQNKV